MTELIMDLEALLANLDAFKARLDTLESEMAAKDAELEKVTQNRDSILKEKRQLEGRTSFQAEMDAFDKRLAEQMGIGKSGAVTISRADARDGGKYREARAAAEKAGVPLQIIDDQGPAQQGKRSSPVKYVKDADAGILYVNADMIQRHGQARCRQIAAEQGATTVRAFRSVDDLPTPMQQAHAQAIADRSDLLGEQ